MPKIKWDMWKKTFPLKCKECDYIHSNYRRYCEQCGAFKSLIKTEKNDYKRWKEKN